VLRRLCLAVLFCLSAWALADRTFADRAATLAADGTTSRMGASIGTALATLPIDTHPPEARWEALLPQGIGGGSSRSHQLQQLHAVELPGVSSRAPWPVVHRAHAARHAARSRPPHLHDTPLLI
jgi:hypothetical protein